MNRKLFAVVLPVLLLGACAGDGAFSVGKPASVAEPAALSSAIGGAWRTPAYVARDKYRHPLQTLSFFGVAPDQTVIEILPAPGWYSEILAPYLRDRGHYIATTWDDASSQKLRDKFAADPADYGKAEIRGFDAKAPVFGRDGSADVVLTFRNVHNWLEDGNAEAYFKAFFAVLKSGGTLGVVDHRARPGTDVETMKTSGYLTEALVIDLAKQAGFVPAGKSEVNANPADDTHHPNGVWTLPPTNKHDKADDAKYQAIGESDRMTLKFVKLAK